VNFRTSVRLALAVTAFSSICLAPHLRAFAAEEASSVCKDGLICLDQGWSDDQRNWWYTTSQGSRLLPLSWALALELPSSAEQSIEKFLSDKTMRRLGYLTNPVSSTNPFGLPLGFAVDEDTSSDSELMCDTFPASCRDGLMRDKWVGMTCSACHTNDIEYGGKRFRVEGAPTLADFQGLTEEVFSALRATLDDQSKFDRFARDVLKDRASDDTTRALRNQLAEQVAWQERLRAINQSGVRYGHARLDAQGHILNKVVLTIKAPDQIFNVRADAPASYPFIWNTAQQSRLQWNGIAENGGPPLFIDGKPVPAGPLARNTSEVIGVFAHLETHKGTALAEGYKSSLRLRPMVQLEDQLATLKSPRWPQDILGPIDEAKADRGQVHFDARCKSCHQPLGWDDLTTKIEVVMEPIQSVQTDVFLACNTFLHRAKAGNFEGQISLSDQVIGPEDFTRHMLGNSALGAIVHKLITLDSEPLRNSVRSGRVSKPAPPAAEYLPDVSDKQKKAQAQECIGKDNELLAYKARPLNGIWATAPYLHNGSVPTLYDLLLAETVQNVRTASANRGGGGTRPETFGVGSHEFDPRKVGFNTDPAKNPTTFRVRKEQTGEPIPGNFNSGHSYGTDLTEEQRYELVEYLKRL
jgi:hypothetical protein